MQSLTHEVLEYPYNNNNNNISNWKVHASACLEVQNLMNKITRIFTALDSARPRCKSGLQVLLSLHRCMENCKSHLHHCSESSKLYLAICGERIIFRCEKMRNSLESCLSQLQNMVEPTLAAQIAQIVDYLHTVAFTLDTSEDEAGRVILALLYQDIKTSKTANNEELKAFKFAAVRLHMTSPLALVIEKRSIRKIITKINHTDPAKKKIMNYLLYLVRKYGNSIKAQEIGDGFDSFEPPMRFENRHQTTFSTASSLPSFNGSLGNLNLDVNNLSFTSLEADTEDGLGEIQEKIEGLKCRPITDDGPDLFILGNLSVLSWASRRKAVEDVKDRLKDDQESHVFISTSYIKPVFKFLKEAHRLGDSGAKRHGAELLLIFLKECRSDVPPLPKDAMHDLVLFLDSEITEEALLILEVMTRQKHYISEIVTSGILLFVLKLIVNQKSKHHNVTLRVLCNMSTHIDLGHHLIYLGFIEQLVPFLDDLLLSGYCVKIFKNLCAIEEAAAHFVENERCIVSIGELLEVGKEEEQENALDILLSLYYQCEDVHDVLMHNTIVSSLTYISENGSCKGKSISIELLKLLNNVQDDHSQVCSFTDTSQSTNSDPKVNNSGSKSKGLLGKIISKFRKSVK
ncbi:U-box domain-containing protein 5-like [Rutidosis leptorrhynchoides]|uniref:U-box domain-containing protein 5-like n=1 Tax=Rutidosis leptorrhynchoides TaxID=125765 RepID=UPI003A9912F3